MKRSTYKRVLDAARDAGAVRQGGWGLSEVNLFNRLNPFKATESWVIRESGCRTCPLGACLVGTTIQSGNEDRDAADLLGLTVKEVAAFVEGFDLGFDENSARCGPFFLAGVRMRNTLKREGVL